MLWKYLPVAVLSLMLACADKDKPTKSPGPAGKLTASAVQVASRGPNETISRFLNPPTYEDSLANDLVEGERIEDEGGDGDDGDDGDTGSTGSSNGDSTVVVDTMTVEMPADTNTVTMTAETDTSRTDTMMVEQGEVEEEEEEETSQADTTSGNMTGSSQ